MSFAMGYPVMHSQLGWTIKTLKGRIYRDREALKGMMNEARTKINPARIRPEDAEKIDEVEAAVKQHLLNIEEKVLSLKPVLDRYGVK